MTAIASHGTLLKRNGTTIADVKDISGPNFSRGTIDCTSHSSASGWKEFVTGMKENGEVTFSINFDPAAATHAYDTGLLDDFIDGTLQTFSLVFPGSVTWGFTAYVTAFGVTEPVEGVLGANVTLKLSGAPTLA